MPIAHCFAILYYLSDFPNKVVGWELKSCVRGWFSHTVGLSARSDKHWTVIAPICGCIAQHKPAQFSHAHDAAHQAHFDRKIDSNYYEEEKKEAKNERKVPHLITTPCKLLFF